MNRNTIRRFHFFLLLAICSLVSANAQIRLGYCNEEPTVSSLGHASTTATISCAMGLSKQLQAPYTDLSLSHIRVAIMEPERLTSLRVWVRESLSDTTTIASAEVDVSTLEAGWNSLALNAPIVLDAQKVLYCGYSYTQSERLDLAISGKKGTTNAFWIAANENWLDYSKKYSPICIQAELTSPYANAITLSNCQLEHAYVNSDDQPQQLLMQFGVTNRAMQPLTHFGVSYQMPDAEPVVTTLAFESEPLTFGQSASLDFVLPVPSNLNGPDQKVMISLVNPNGEENETATLASDSLWFEVGETLPVDDSALILVEKFTSLDNGYAPIGMKRLRDALTQCDRPTVMISRHEGYGPADMLKPGNSDYAADFFGSDKLNFVPAVWIDRDGQPVSSTIPVDSLVEKIASINHPRYASIVCDSIAYSDSQNSVEAYFEVTMHSITAFRNPCLIVCFTQNTLEISEQKNYYPESYDGTSQSNVVRCFASLPAGGSLLSGANLDAVSHGRVPVSMYKKQQVKATLSLPSNSSFSAGEWHIVAYVSDRGETHKLLGVEDITIGGN